jgi:hypothetical protein
LADEDYASEEIARIRRRLADLDAERVSLERELETLEQKLISDSRAAERHAFAQLLLPTTRRLSRKSSCSGACSPGVPMFSRCEDAGALLQTCRGRGIAATLERSRSGNGGHVWIFFSCAYHAASPRPWGAALPWRLRRAARPERTGSERRSCLRRRHRSSA